LAISSSTKSNLQQTQGGELKEGKRSLWLGKGFGYGSSSTALLSSSITLLLSSVMSGLGKNTYPAGFVYENLRGESRLNYDGQLLELESKLGGGGMLFVF